MNVNQLMWILFYRCLRVVFSLNEQFKVVVTCTGSEATMDCMLRVLVIPVDS